MKHKCRSRCSQMKLWVWFSALTWETLSSWQIQDREKKDKWKEQEKEQAQTKGEKREAPGAGGGGAGGAGRQECALVAMVGCHVLTCPSVFILGELRLFVDDHASDGHVRVLLFGLLYSLGQRLTVTINTNKTNTNQTKDLREKITNSTRMKTQLNTHRWWGNTHAHEQLQCWTCNNHHPV